MADAIMSSGAAGKVVGPRPGKAACSFKEGVIEIVLRVITGIVAILPAVSGSLILAYAVGGAPERMNKRNATANSTAPPNELIPCGAGALALIAGFFICVWAIIMLILRFLNIGLLNLGSKAFLITDVVVNLVFAIVLIVGIILSIVTAVDWQNEDDGVFGSAIAAIVTCFFSALVTILLAVYMIVYINRGYNNEIIKYTLKDAITG